MKRETVITGMGVVSPTGVGISDFSRSLKEGRSGIGPISRFDSTFLPVHIAAEVRDFSGKNGKHDRFLEFAITSSGEAVKSAGLDFKQIDPSRTAVVFSSSKGGMETVERELEAYERSGFRGISKSFFENYYSGSAADLIGNTLGIRGPRISVVSACSTGAHTVIYGARLIEEGKADVVIAGASDSSITSLLIGGYARMDALSKTGMRPFDLKRDGFVVGEGAGTLILERKEHALKRGTDIKAEVIGSLWAEDPHHITSFNMEERILAKALKKAVNTAGLIPLHIDYINTHGASTELGDSYETACIKEAFGDDAYSIPLSSTKSMTGHMLGASGLVEVIACVIAMEKGFIPPTINYRNFDPRCDLDYTTGSFRLCEVNTALSISMGFGGHIGLILLKKGGE